MLRWRQLLFRAHQLRQRLLLPQRLLDHGMTPAGHLQRRRPVDEGRAAPALIGGKIGKPSKKGTGKGGDSADLFWEKKEKLKRVNWQLL